MLPFWASLFCRFWIVGLRYKLFFGLCILFDIGIAEILPRPLVAEFVRHITAETAAHRLLIVVLHFLFQILPRLAVDVVEAIQHLFLGVHHKAGKSGVSQTLGLHVLHDA